MTITARRWRPLFLLLVLISCVGCDQASKKYAMENFKGRPQPVASYLGDTFRIHYAENPGAFLGLMGNLSRQTRMWILTIANSVVMLLVAGYLLFATDLDRLSLVALALIVAGGVGNLIDRVMWDGVVIDFLNVGIGPLRTGIFNVADMAITGGFLLLLPQLFRKEEQSSVAQAESAT